MAQPALTPDDIEALRWSRQELKDLPDYVLLDTVDELEPIAPCSQAVRIMFAVICGVLVQRHNLDRDAVLAHRPIAASLRAEIAATKQLQAATN